MSNRGSRKIRVVVLGDAGVGKTKWVSRLVAQKASNKIDRVFSPVTLPPEYNVRMLENVHTLIIDTPSDPQHEARVNEEIRLADIILLFYDITIKETADRLSTYWLPRIQREKANIPVIVIANKIDLIGDPRNQNCPYENNKVHRVIVPLIKNFIQVEIGLQCSALRSPNIRDIIYCTQRSVVYPLAPIYDLRQKKLTEGFKRALTRIFRIFDTDNDGKWNNDELRSFQFDVFKGELDDNDIKGIKEVIREELKKPPASLEQDITLEDFLALQKSCVERIKMQICWIVLRHFGYDDSLELKKEYFQDELIIDRQAGESVELSIRTIEFVKSVFKRFAHLDPFLPLDALEEIFYPIGSVPWQNIPALTQVSQSDNGKQGLSLTSWVVLWNYLTVIDYQRCFKYLKYLGYRHELQESFTVTYKKNSMSQIQKLGQRKVFNVAVIGPKQSGKSRILDNLIARAPQGAGYNPTTTVRHAAQQRHLRSGKRRTFVFIEVPELELEAYFGSENTKAGVDFVVLVYDRDERCKKFLEDYEQLFSGLITPKIIVKTLNDGVAQNGFELLSKEFCLLDFDRPLRADGTEDVLTPLFESLQNLLERPQNGLSREIVQYLHETDSFFVKNRNLSVAGIALVCVLGTAAIIGVRKYGSFSALFKNIKQQIVSIFR